MGCKISSELCWRVVVYTCILEGFPVQRIWFMYLCTYVYIFKTTLKLMWLSSLPIPNWIRRSSIYGLLCRSFCLLPNIPIRFVLWHFGLKLELHWCCIAVFVWVSLESYLSSCSIFHSGWFYGNGCTRSWVLHTLSWHFVFLCVEPCICSKLCLDSLDWTWVVA